MVQVEEKNVGSKKKKEIGIFYGFFQFGSSDVDKI